MFGGGDGCSLIGGTVEDCELMRRVQRGDRAAFETIVLRHQDVVFGYLRARLLQAGDAEDLAQEVFLRCYTACGAFDTAQALRPWLIGIARNLLREFARKQKRRKEVYWVELCLEVDESANPAEGVYDEVIEHLPDCLQTLGGSAREAINLKYGGRLRLAEIGRRLRRSEGAVKLLMFRARQTLRSCLAGKCKISPDE